MIIEVCAESYEHAMEAEKAGADRIELCKDLHLDGVLHPIMNLLKEQLIH